MCRFGLAKKKQRYTQTPDTDIQAIQTTTATRTIRYGCDWRRNEKHQVIICLMSKPNDKRNGIRKVTILNEMNDRIDRAQAQANNVNRRRWLVLFFFFCVRPHDCGGRVFGVM